VLSVLISCNMAVGRDESLVVCNPVESWLEAVLDVVLNPLSRSGTGQIIAYCSKKKELPDSEYLV
jgi:hypothetical protein